MQKRNLTVGIFLVAGIALFTLGLFLIGKQHNIFGRHFEVYTEFANLDGLTKGGKVKIAGFDGGEVVGITLPDSPRAKFRLRLRLEERVHAVVRADSVVTIATEGVVGDKFLLIHAGTAQSAEAPSGATLPGKEPLELADLMEKSAGLLSNAGGTMKTVGLKLNETLDAATTTMRNANDVVVGLKEGKGTAGMLLRDESTAKRIRQTVESIQKTADSLKHTANQADALVSDLNSRHLGQAAKETISSARQAADNVNATTKQIQQTVSASLGPNEQGVDAATDVRQTISNLNQATVNMVDDTEAVKRNFFLRGFFKQRGYYTLANISAEEYRRNRLFSNRGTHREWLSGEELFEAGANDDESLSTIGKKRIDAIVTSWTDSLGSSPLVIEGYSTNRNAADRIALARARAIIVRDYIRLRFHLDPQRLVSVALGNQPPAGSIKAIGTVSPLSFFRTIDAESVVNIEPIFPLGQLRKPL